MWFLISVPMCFAGAYLGLKKERLSAPVRVNQIPRQIPQQTFFTKRIPAIFGGAVLPFGVIIIELGFILDSIWAQHVYYMFGLLLLIGFILFVICAEVSIVLCYFQLCAEVRSTYCIYSAGLSMVVACVFGAGRIGVVRLSILVHSDGIAIPNGRCDFDRVVFGMVAGVFRSLFYRCWYANFFTCLFPGFIGFVSTLLFARKIYSSIKID